MKNDNKIMAVMMSLMFCVGAFAVLAVQDAQGGTAQYENDIALGAIPSDAIPISTPADLALVGSTGATSGTYPRNGYYLLMNNIELTGTNNHVPIGGFTGTFDGNGFVISGLNISGYDNAGLFGILDGDVINLGLENISIKGNTYAGGIAGRCGVNGKISNCYTTGEVSTTTSITSVKYAGGIAGTGGSITNCYSLCNVSAPGLLGYANGISGLTSNRVINCYSVGEISASNTSGIADVSNTGRIINCYFLYGTASQLTQGSTHLTIDGVSTPERLTDPDQSSGAKSLSDMQPDATTAISNESIYFRGITTGQATGPIDGWDFNNTWVAKSGEYPTLKVFDKSGEITDPESPSLAILTILRDSNNPKRVYASSSMSIGAISIDFGDGSDPYKGPNAATWHTYEETGLYTITLTATNGENAPDTDSETIVVHDAKPATVAWTMVEYRYTPNIDISETPTVTITGPGGTPATWLSWDSVSRSVVGMPYAPAAGNEYNVSLTDSSGTVTWKIQVIGSITYVPTFNISWEIDGKTVSITTISNVGEGSAMLSWTIKNASGATVGLSNVRDPSFTVPAFGTYIVSGTMSANVNGTVKDTTGSWSIDIKDNTEPEPDTEDDEPMDVMMIVGMVSTALGALLAGVGIFGRQYILLIAGLIAILAGVFLLGLL